MRAYVRWWRSLTDLDWWVIGMVAVVGGAVIYASGLPVIGLPVWAAGLAAVGWGGAGALLGMVAKM